MELLSLSLRCGTRPFTVTICSVLSQFTLQLGCTKVTDLYLSLSAVCLSLSLFINCLHGDVQSLSCQRQPADDQSSRFTARIPATSQNTTFTDLLAALMLMVVFH